MNLQLNLTNPISVMPKGIWDLFHSLIYGLKSMANTSAVPNGTYAKSPIRAFDLVPLEFIPWFKNDNHA